MHVDPNLTPYPSTLQINCHNILHELNSEMTCNRMIGLITLA